MTSSPRPDNGQLFIVALPIGNHEDISLRAMNTLKNVDCVVAEDTRTFAELAAKLGIKAKRLLAYHEHNERESTLGLIELLKNGQTIAQVSDAGTPGVSDPGYHLVRAALNAGIKVTPLPGPSSLTTALSVNPIGGKTHFFGGFLSNKRTDRIKEMTNYAHTSDRLIFLESPHRVIEHLEDALSVFGDVEVALFRELTKPYEEIIWSTISQALTRLKSSSPKGEFVIIFAAPPSQLWSLEKTKNEALAMLDEGVSARDIRELLQKKSELSRKEIYDIIEELKKNRE